MKFGSSKGLYKCKHCGLIKAWGFLSNHLHKEHGLEYNEMTPFQDHFDLIEKGVIQDKNKEVDKK